MSARGVYAALLILSNCIDQAGSDKECVLACLCPSQVKIIDFGAAVDMCTGINFNPLFGMLDPRYSPPEELVMPQSESVVEWKAAEGWVAPAPGLLGGMQACRGRKGL